MSQNSHRGESYPFQTFSLIAGAVRDYAAVGLAFSLAIILIIGAGTYHTTRQFILANQWETHTLEVDQTVSDLFSYMQELPSSARSYVTSGDESFAVTREKLVARINGSMDKLKKLLADDPQQQERLEKLGALVARRIAWSEELIAARRNQGRDAATAKMTAEARTQSMTPIRIELTGIRIVENASLEQRTVDMRNSAGLSILGLCAGTAVSGIILLVVFSLLRQENMQRRKTEAKFKGLLESAPDASVIVNRNGNIVLVNSQAERAFGYTREELLGQKIEMLIPAGYQEKIARPRLESNTTSHALPSTNVGLELYGLRKDGTEFPVEISLSPLETEEGSIVIGSIRDITERKRLQQERDLFFNLSLDLMCVAGFDGYFKRVNPAWKQTLGYTSEELTNRPFIVVVHPDDRATTSAKAQENYEGGRAVGFENRYRCQDGSYRWLSWSAIASQDLRRTFAVARDVTAQKLRDQEVRQLNQDLQARTAQLESANKELEAFSYSVSHDLRAPLRAIDGFSRMLEKDSREKLDEAGRERLQRIRAATQQMASLIDDMLSLSKITRAEMHRRPVDLSATAENIVAELQKSEPERKVVCRIAPGIKASGDAVLLHAVLQNLLGNAWKFTSKRSQPTIEFGRQPGDADVPVFFVRDNGAGFDMAYAQKLFEAFQRLHTSNEFEGTGIGLATVQRIIQRHGGRVWAEGAVDKGATFYFTLG